MAKQLNLYFDNDSLTLPAPQLAVQYAVIDNGELSATGHSPLAELPAVVDDLASCEINAVLPGEHVLCGEIPLPQIKRRHLDQALPYLLEDELATSVETLHLAYGESANSHCLICAAIDKDLLEQYLSALAAAGISASQMIPDYWTLPPADQLQLAARDSRLLARMPSAEGVSLPASADQQVLQALFADQPESQLQDALEQIAEWQPGAITAAPVNLLQGAYAAPKNSATHDWLKPAAIAAAISLVVFMVYFLTVGWHFNQRADDLSAEAESLYRTLFPDDKKIINIRRQMEARLNSSEHSETDSLFFDLLTVLAAANEGQNSSLSIRNLRFNQQNASLHIEVQAPSINYVNNLQTQIAQKGISAEVLSANSNAEGVLARLRLQPEGLK